MKEELSRIIEKREIRSLFQEVVDCRRRGVFGYEALIRGPAESPLHLPLNLFAAARAFDRSQELELLAIDTVLAAFSARAMPGCVFLNASPASFLHFQAQLEYLGDALSRYGIESGSVVLELTEESAMRDYDSMRRAVVSIRDLGCRIAMDDLGAGYSSLRTWAEIRPDFVRLDRYFVANVDRDPLKVEFLRSIIDIAHAGQSAVIAEGIESAGECRELAQLEVEYLQGFYFGEPAEQPPPPDRERIDALLGVEEHDEYETADGVLAGRLLREPPSVSPATPVPELLRLFSENEEQTAIAVVEAGHPVGIVRRSQLFVLLSKPDHMERYAARDAAAVMERHPPSVDVGLRLEQVSHLLTANSKMRLEYDFILTRQGRYAGMGKTLDLLKRLTEQQVRRARSANPLTALPGNGPIDDCMDRMLRSGERFCACYIDLDNFKPFNDFYGFAKGDDVLIHMAQLLSRHAAPSRDFVGHIGGDDFVVIFRSPDWQDRVRAMIRDFSREMPAYYSAEHRAAKGISTEDRYGVRRHFPLLSVTTAAVWSDCQPFHSAEEIAAVLSDVKHEAKKIDGCGALLLTADGLQDFGGPRAVAASA